MQLCRVKLQTHALDADVVAFRVVGNDDGRPQFNDWRTLGQLHQRCNLVELAATNAYFRSPSIGFFTTPGKKLQLPWRFIVRPTAGFVLDGFAAYHRKQIVWILFNSLCHNLPII